MLTIVKSIHEPALGLLKLENSCLIIMVFLQICTIYKNISFLVEIREKLLPYLPFHIIDMSLVFINLRYMYEYLIKRCNISKNVLTDFPTNVMRY